MYQESMEVSNSGRENWGLLASMLLGAILAFSAFTKIAAPKAFVASVAGYGLFPESLLLPLTTGLVGLELALGAMLLTGLGRWAAAWMTLPLLVYFLGMLLYAMKAGLDSCGCFNEAISIPPRVELLLDVGLLLLCVATLRWGRDARFGGAGLVHGLGWGSLCFGAFLFLAGGPAQAAGQNASLTPPDSAIAALTNAQPPLQLQEDAFLFLFDADCSHCWAFAGGVDLSATLLEGLQVVGVTASDFQAVEDFEMHFNPSWPIHRLKEGEFNALTDEFPASLWFSGGILAEGWKGFAPSHRELAQMGGYEMREAELDYGYDEEPDADEDAGSAPASPFGGTERVRH